ncbi:uncharacterized protein [Amphiura filiformis]|uniref:uncharacterized protein n=1 Tax=Amphiura filiformis TaxID=82378 RepID=UPI003B228233
MIQRSNNIITVTCLTDCIDETVEINPCDDAGISEAANAHCSVITNTFDLLQNEKHFIGGLRYETDTPIEMNTLDDEDDVVGIADQHGTRVTGDTRIDTESAAKIATGQILGNAGDNSRALPRGGRYSRFRYKRQQANGGLSLNHQVHAESMNVQYSAVGLLPSFRDPVTVNANVKFSDSSSVFQGSGLWKLSMYGSKNNDGTGEQFQRYDQLLSTTQQAQTVTPGEDMNFNQANGDIDMTAIGCNMEYRYLCFDFTESDNSNPTFTFTSSQDDTSKITFCSDRCETLEGTAVSIGLKYNLEATGITEGQKDSFIINATARFSEASDDIQGTGLWKLSMFGSRNQDGTGEQLERVDQLLTTTQQALPLVGAQNITFIRAGGEFDFNLIGCGTEFRYLCFEFTKGDNPNPDFQFILPGGLTTYRTCSDRCAPIENGVLTSGLHVAWTAHEVHAGVKDHFTLNATVTFAEVSDEIRGFGLWKLAMYGSKNSDGSGEQFQRFDELLTNSHQAQPLIGDGDITFYGAHGELDITRIGCDIEYRYICFDFMKGDNPYPDFNYTSFQSDTTKTTLCTNRCKPIAGTAVVRGLNITWSATGVRPNQRDPFTMNATIQMSQASAPSITGTGLWKLSMYGSGNENGTGVQYQRVEQLLNASHQAQPLTEGQDMVFINASGNLDILGIGCGLEFRYLCFDFAKGDNPQPDFNFTSLQKADSSKITLCSDRCSQVQDLRLQNGFILVADLAGAIRIAPLDTFNEILTFQTIPLQQLGAPVAVDFDPVYQKIYYTDVLTKTIQRSNLDGSLQEVILSLGSESTPDGLAVDDVHRLLYWTDATLHRIEKSNLDGSERSVIMTSPKPRAIVVDKTNNRLFWTDWGSTPKIERANADGTNRVTLIDTHLQWPNGLAVDFPGGRMYWCEAGLNRIESSDLNGNNRLVHLNTGNNLDIHPYDLGIYQDVIVWSDWAFRNLVKMGVQSIGQARLTGDPVFRRGGGLHIQQAFQPSRTRRSTSQSNGPFTKCHDVINPADFFNQCTENWCGSESYEQLCDDIADYANACQLHGIDVGDWRGAAGCDEDNGNQ